MSVTKASQYTTGYAPSESQGMRPNIPEALVFLIYFLAANDAGSEKPDPAVAVIIFGVQQCVILILLMMSQHLAP
jgi:hypothetical protein